MLLAMDLPNEEGRQALAPLLWANDAFHLAGYVRASLDNQSIDLIDLAVGPGHARTALVTLYEGADVLLQAALELAEASVEQAVFTRLIPLNPLDREERCPIRAGNGFRFEPPAMGSRTRRSRSQAPPTTSSTPTCGWPGKRTRRRSTRCTPPVSTRARRLRLCGRPSKTFGVDLRRSRCNRSAACSPRSS